LFTFFYNSPSPSLLIIDKQGTLGPL